MNNSFMAGESVKLEIETAVDLQPQFRAKATELADLIEALEKVHASNYWKTLEQTIFHDELDNLKSLLCKEENHIKIYRLQGEIKRAEKYDLAKLIMEKRNQLTNLTQQIHD